MIQFLLDTNIPSELRNDPVNAAVLRWQAQLDSPEQLFISVITLGEIQKGIDLVPDGARKTRIREWLELEVMDWFAGRILPVTAAVALRWGRLAAARRRQGHALHPADGLIAATALEHGLVLVTRNVKDFQDLGLTIVNPFEYAG